MLAVLTASLATFLVVLGLLAAQLRAGRDPGLARAAPARVLALPGPGGVLRTRSSGTPTIGSGGRSAAASLLTAGARHGGALLTRASGAPGSDDEAE